MKKIIFTAYNLDVGGIERALINLLNEIDYQKYQVTLLLEKKEGLFLNEIPRQVKIMEYKISTHKFVPLRKIINRLKLITTMLSNYHRYDFACCYAPYSVPGSALARSFAKNNAIWIHSDYYYLYQQDLNKIKHFFNGVKISKFKNIIFVSNEAKQNFLRVYPILKDKLIVCNNIINYDSVLKYSNEPIEEIKPNKILFINIARHDEDSKRLTRLIEASAKLVEHGLNFEVWLIGSGKDTELYRQMIEQLKLEKQVKLLGFKNNPYPYYKLADAYILTSEYEGFPVVFIESMINKLPIITTVNVSDQMININNNYGMVIEKDINAIAKAMEYFIEKGFEVKVPFDVNQYNQSILNRVYDLINNKDVK